MEPKRVIAICKGCAEYNGGEWNYMKYPMVALQFGQCTVCSELKEVVSPGYWRNISGGDASRYRAPVVKRASKKPVESDG